MIEEAELDIREDPSPMLMINDVLKEADLEGEELVTRPLEVVEMSLRTEPGRR